MVSVDVKHHVYLLTYSVGRCNTDVGLSPRCDKDFFSLPVSFQCRLSYTVHTAPICNCMHNICVNIKKIPNTGSHTIVWTRRNTAHTLWAVVPYPGKVTWIFCKGQWVTTFVKHYLSDILGQARPSFQRAIYDVTLEGALLTFEFWSQAVNNDIYPTLCVSCSSRLLIMTFIWLCVYHAVATVDKWN